MIAIILVISSLIIKLSHIGRYHRAEHMAFSAYERDPNLTLEQVRRQLRTHSDCGTNCNIGLLLLLSLNLFNPHIPVI
jgi:uncharacterized protein YqhQ